jgi:hypothetical protein
MFKFIPFKLKLVVFTVVMALAVVIGQPGVVGAMAAPGSTSGPIIVNATSFSVDTTSMLDTAAGMFNSLWPVFGVVVGIILALGLVTLLVTELRKAI